MDESEMPRRCLIWASRDGKAFLDLPRLSQLANLPKRSTPFHRPIHPAVHLSTGVLPLCLQTNRLAHLVFGRALSRACSADGSVVPVPRSVSEVHRVWHRLPHIAATRPLLRHAMRPAKPSFNVGEGKSRYGDFKSGAGRKSRSPSVGRVAPPAWVSELEAIPP